MKFESVEDKHLYIQAVCKPRHRHNHLVRLNKMKTLNKTNHYSSARQYQHNTVSENQNQEPKLFVLFDYMWSLLNSNYMFKVMLNAEITANNNWVIIKSP